MKEKTKVTIALFSYNQEKYIKKSLISCFEQNYENLTIVISDDSSQDNTYSIIKKITSSYKGAHRIVINQNCNNLGIGHHFAYVMENLVEGELVVMLGGDDISKPNRVTRIVQEWKNNNKPSLVAHSLEEIDEDDNVFIGDRTFQYEHQDNTIHSNKIYSMIEYHKFHYPIYYLGAAVAYRVDTYMEFGSPKTYPDCEDHLMYFRSLLAKGVHYFDEKLVSYGRHENSYTSKEIKPFHDNSSSYLLFLLDKKNGMHEKYINCFSSHKIIVQQWIDYTYKINTNEVKIDFQLVESIWQNMLHRHKFLVKNKGFKSNSIIFFKKILNVRSHNRFIAKTYNMNYVAPLKAVIFGTTSNIEKTLSRIGPGFNIIFVCNTEKNMSKKLFSGIKTVKPKQLNKIINETDCILVADKSFYKIKESILKNTSIQEDRIIRLPVSIISM